MGVEARRACLPLMFGPRSFAQLDEKLRPWLVRLPAELPVRLYSLGRARFLATLVADVPEVWTPGPELGQELWGIRFRAPLGNAAGMFKNGEGYALSAAQGAGYYLAGTTTALARRGNRERGVRCPFVPYPRSRAAANRLGLPNEGDEVVAGRLAGLSRVAGCPVGASLAADPELGGEEAIAALVRGLGLYDAAGVDFLEINESCPNTGEEVLERSGLAERLTRVAELFLAQRRRPLPVLIKFSCDVEASQVAGLVDLLLELGFDGVDFGNTSRAYARHRAAIALPERRLFDHFVRHYGGGLSGRPLKPDSLALAAAAAARVRELAPAREFHVVRTGGVEDAADLAASRAAGVALCGWYTGYFAAFAAAGHGLYRRIFEA